MRTPLTFLACLACFSHAHESPSDSLEHLDKHIAENPTPELLFQRAMAYKALGKIDQARADLNKASNEQPKHIPWQIERCQLELTAKRPADALHIANAALKLAKNGPERAEIHILRAQAYQNTSKYKPSLHACQLAFKELAEGKLDWFILRSENQRQLGLHQQRIQDLLIGLKKFPDTILKSHWVDALLDAGNYPQALAQIEKELPTLRWKSHWQIKQARALAGLNRKPESDVLLKSAMEEINSRLNPSQPDILLLADQAEISVIMGDKKSTRSILKKLHDQQAPEWVTSRLKASLSGK